MGEILKFPGEATPRLGFRRVHKRRRRSGDPNQLDLFADKVLPLVERR